MAGQAAETLIGAAVLAVAGVFLVYTIGTAEVSVRDGYPLVAEFRQAEGISVGNDVRIAGVKVGSVTDMRLNPKTFYASITLSIVEDVEVPDDSVAKIASTNLLGEAFVAIVPGASDQMLAAGDEIVYTQSSISIGDLIGRFVGGAQEQ